MSKSEDYERAKKHLEAWQAADLAVSTGQSYSIGSRSLTRANISEIRKQITYWKNELYSSSGKRGIRSKLFVPRDL